MLYPGTDPVDAEFFQAVQRSPAIDWLSVHSYCGDFVAQAHHPFVLATGKPVVTTPSERAFLYVRLQQRI